ncbi:helix-turn-helix domain-containing protein, partial [Bartonella raoultii]|uniref:helix-turn-helix domain-containing protein n=1 Tax=Bartonella raoultii TaxID=1457020 RepID=UPI00280B92C1
LPEYQCEGARNRWGKMQGKNPHNDIFVEKFIGKKIRFRRNMLKMSQKQLGQSLGVSFQQIQKYEKGSNRVSAGQLKKIADILNVPITFFMPISPQNNTSPTLHDEIASSREEYLLLKNFRVLTTLKRRAILQLLSDQNESF